MVFVDANGNEIDRTVGYYQGPEKYKERLEGILKGENTFEALKKQYEADPDNIALAFEVARKYQNMRNRAEHDRIIKQVVEENAAAAKKTTIPYYRDRQANAYEYGRYILSSNIFMTRDPEPLLEFVEEFPDGDFTESAYMSLGNFFMFYGDPEEADAFFETVLEKYPASPRMLTYFIMYSERTKRNLEKAKEVADDVIAMQQVVFNDPYSNRARILALLPDSIDLPDTYGAEHIERRAAVFARELSSYASFWFQRNENLESAMDAAKRALTIDPGNGYLRYTLAYNLMNADKKDEALKVFGPDAILDFADDPSLISLYVRFWSDQNANLENAFEMAEVLYEENPEDGNAAQALAKIYFLRGDEKKAVQLYGEDQIKDFWDGAAQLNTYAWFWAELGGNLKHALKASLRSIELEPENHFYLDTAALICFKLGEIKDAVKYQGKAYEISKDPSYKQKLEEYEAALK